MILLSNARNPPKFAANCWFAGPLDDVLVDLQAALHEEGVASPICTNLLHDCKIDAAKSSSTDDALEYGGVAETSSSASIPALTANPGDLKPKKNRRGRRSAGVAGPDGRPREFESTVTSVAAPEAITAVDSSGNDAVATADPKSQVLVTDENADDADCSSPVMHREYFLHVRRVNLENLSLVIGSNLPVFQVHLPRLCVAASPLSLQALDLTLHTQVSGRSAVSVRVIDSSCGAQREERLLDAWLDAVVAAVPELVVCWSQGGVVQDIETIGTFDARSKFPGTEMLERGTSEMLSWLLRECMDETASYIVMKEKDGCVISLGCCCSCNFCTIICAALLLHTLTTCPVKTLGFSKSRTAT